MKIGICICTYRRPYELARVLRFLTTACLPNGRLVLVIDNDPARSAEPVARQYHADYVVEPSRGHAIVRNTALQAAFARGCDKAAFVDDDDLPHKDWLLRLMEHDAGLVFGRWHTTQSLPDHLRRIPLFQPPRSDVKTKNGVALPIGIATCNVMISRTVMDKLGRNPFDEAFNETGGEDKEFFIRAAKAGLGWALAPASQVNKMYGDDRLSLSSILRLGYRRSFGKYLIAKKHAPRAEVQKRVWRARKTLVIACLKLPFVVTNPAQRGATLYRVAQALGTVRAAGQQQSPVISRQHLNKQMP